MRASSETWRCFVAVPIPENLRSSLIRAVAGWRALPGAPDLRWSDPEGWHVTLAFLGPVPPERVPLLVGALTSAVRPFAPFAVATGSVGAFPRPGAAMTVWYGLTDPMGNLAALADAVGEAVLPPGGTARFRPHLTLGRSRVRRGEPMGPWLASLTVPNGSLPVSDVVMYRSHLGRGPARYEVLTRAALRGAEFGHA
jgi:2'-5' RNA ligase